MKILNTIFLLFVLWLCAACYDDEGNYDYTDKLGIRVEGIEENYRVVTLKDTVKFRPKIYPENRQYECFWGILKKEDTWAVIDTLSHKKDWDFAVNLRTGNYLLRFCAKDVETGIFSYIEYNLSVETDMAIGWWVLKSNAAGTDVDLFTPDRKISDVVFANNGRYLPGEARGILYSSDYWEYDSVSRKDLAAKVVFLESDQDLVALDFYSGRIMRSYEDLFYEAPQQRKLQDLFNGSVAIHVRVNDRIYTMPTTAGSGHYKQFTTVVQGNYQLSSYRHSPGKRPVMFDELTSSFCSYFYSSVSMDYFKDGSGYPSPNHLGMNLLFIGAKTINSVTPGSEAYAILKKKEADEYWLAQLTGRPTNMNNPMRKLEQMPNHLGVLHADFRTMNQNNDIIYFSKGNEVSACNLVTYQEVPQNLGIPSSETITYMEYLKFSPSGLDDLWFDYVAIGTVRGGYYKVYLHPVQAGTILPATEVLQGEGQVKRIMYIRTANNSVYTTTLF